MQANSSRRPKNSLLFKKQIQWQEEKSQQSECFPFGLHRRLQANKFRAVFLPSTSTTNNGDTTVSVTNLAASLQNCSLDHSPSKRAAEATMNLAQSSRSVCGTPQKSIIPACPIWQHCFAARSAPCSLNFAESDATMPDNAESQASWNYCDTPHTNCQHVSYCCCCHHHAKRCCCACAVHHCCCAAVPASGDIPLVVNHVRMTRCELVHRALSPIGSDNVVVGGDSPDIVVGDGFDKTTIDSRLQMSPCSVSSVISHTQIVPCSIISSSAAHTLKNDGSPNNCPSYSESCGSESTVTDSSTHKKHYRTALITKLAPSPTVEHDQQLYQAEIEQQLKEKRRLRSVQEKCEREEAERVEKERRALESRDQEESLKELNKWKKLEDEEERRMQSVRLAWEQAKSEAQAIKRAKLLKHALGSGEKVEKSSVHSDARNYEENYSPFPVPPFYSPDNQQDNNHVIRMTSSPAANENCDNVRTIFAANRRNSALRANTNRDDIPVHPTTTLSNNNSRQYRQDFDSLASTISSSLDEANNDSSSIFSIAASRNQILKIYEQQEYRTTEGRNTRNTISGGGTANGKRIEDGKNPSSTGNGPHSVFNNTTNKSKRRNPPSRGAERTVGKGNFIPAIDESEDLLQLNKISRTIDEKYFEQNNNNKEYGDKSELDIIRKMQDLERKLRLEQKLLSDKLTGQKRN